MPNRKAAFEALRHSRKRTEVNQRNKTSLKTAVREFEALLAQKEGEKARAAFPGVVAKLKRSVGKGVLNRNTASRKVSRLSKRLHAIAK